MLILCYTSISPCVRPLYPQDVKISEDRTHNESSAGSNLSLTAVCIFHPFIVGDGTPVAWHLKTTVVWIFSVIFLGVNVKEGADPDPSSEKYIKRSIVLDNQL